MKPKTNTSKPRPARASAPADSGRKNKVIDSLQDILRTLSFVSYQATEDSGDYRHTGSGGRRGVYATYWENEYQFVFFSAFYVLPEELRADPAIMKMAKHSPALYRKYLSDGEACARAYREYKGPSTRIKALRVFDGTRSRPPAPLTLIELLSRMKDDAVLVGWKSGLPRHLAYLGSKSVIGKYA